MDKTTEAWLDSIEERLFYSDWFCGHFHVEKEIDDMHLLFENYIEIPDKIKLLGEYQNKYFIVDLQTKT